MPSSVLREGCPKCKGALHLDETDDLTCVMCGKVLSLKKDWNKKPRTDTYEVMKLNRNPFKRARSIHENY